MITMGWKTTKNGAKPIKKNIGGFVHEPSSEGGRHEESITCTQDAQILSGSF